MKKYKVAVLANLKINAPKYEGMPEDRWDDLDSEKTIEALVNAIRSGGHHSEFLEGDVTLYDTIRKFKPDICFNICESHFGDAREAQVPAILEMLRIPNTRKHPPAELCHDHERPPEHLSEQRRHHPRLVHRAREV